MPPPPSDPVESRTLGALRRLPGELVLAVHAVIAAFALWLAPHGFGPTAPRFWSNTFAPAAVLLVAGAALVILLRERPRQPALALVGLAAAWLALGVVLRLAFPISGAMLWGAAVAAALAAVAAALALGARLAADRRRLATAVGIGLLVGGAAAWGLCPPPPSTRPLEAQVPPPPASPAALPAEATLVDDRVTVAFGAVRAELRPLLTFDLTTPDGAWSLFGRRPPARRLVDAAVSWSRFDDGAAVSLAPGDEAARVRFDAASPVARVTHAHLNTFAELAVEGLAAPSVSFSPLGGRMFDVEPSYSEGGAPLRFAALEPGERFTLFRAPSAEKGPYTREASGKLVPGEPLTVNFYDGGDWRLALRLDDWSAQASVAPSPTAGGGVPQNAIELGRAVGGPVRVWVTLAATSVGRGWDTVGHAPGVYRNRGELRWEKEWEKE